MRLKQLFSQRRLPSLVLGAAALVASLAFSAAPAAAQQLFADDFNGGSFNSGSTWNVYDNTLSIGRTQFGKTPVIQSDGTTSFLRMPLSTYSPAGTLTQGAEVYTKQLFGVGTGVEFEARVRGVNMPKGVCFAFFTYSEKNPRPNDYLKEEIDYEMLSTQPVNKVWSNIWNDGNPRYGGNDGVHQQDSLLTVPGMDYTGWTTYTLRWYPDRMEWYVNGTLARTSTTVVPDDPMAVHFNIWAPQSSWGLAYSADIQPTKIQANDSTCYMDVDYIHVKKLPAPSTGVWGNGDGLKANYYPTKDFTGTPVTRIDPRVFDDWQQYSPDPKIPVDGFSGRWTGAISSPYTENVTFTLRGDDGVRLYINGQKLIDDWIDTSPKDRTVTIPMTAGVKVPITVEYYDGTGGALCMLYWSSPSMAKTVVPQSQLYSFYDVTPPVVNLTAPGEGFSYQTLTVKGSAQDADSMVSTVAVQVKRTSDNQFWNGSAFGAGAVDLPASFNGYDWSIPLTGLPDGFYSVVGRATDKGGNTGASSARSFYIDTVGPTVVLTSPSNGSSFTSVSSMNGYFNDVGAGVAAVGVTVQRASDGFYLSNSRFVAAVSENPATISGGLWKLYTGSLPIGSYIVSARATDFAGNVGAWTRANFSIIDNQAPVATLSAPYNGSSYTAVTSLNGGATDVGSGVAKVGVTLQRGSDSFYFSNSRFAAGLVENTATLSGSSWKFYTGTLAAGTYTVSARATDKSGNVGAWVRGTFTIADGKPPVTALTAPYNGSTYPTVTSMNGTAKDSETAVGAVLLTIRRSSDSYYWNASRFAAAYAEQRATVNGIYWSFYTGSLPAGTYTITARSFDYSGNESPSVTGTFKVTGAAKAAISGGTGADGDSGPSINKS